METGTGKISITLESGDITIKDKDGELLFWFSEVSHGSWQEMIKAITKTLREREL